MSDNTNSASGAASDIAKSAPGNAPASLPAVAAQPALKTVRGQRYVAPAGRHSQQTHRRAAARAAAGGHETQQEQHDHDRESVKAEVSRLTALKAPQKANPAK